MVILMMDPRKILEEEIKRETILINPGVLSESYIPDHLLFREEEIAQITRHFGRFLRGIHPGNLLIHGPPGTGKTHAIQLIARSYNSFAKEQEIDSEMIYVNCKDKTYYQIIVSLLHELGVNFPSRGLGVGEAVDALAKYLKKSSGTYVFIFDEIDKIKRSARDREEPMNALIYRMSRLDELTGKENVAFAVISNRTDILQKLEYFTRSKFIPEIVYFREYNAIELAEILKDRVEKAFKPGTVDEAVPKLLAALIKRSGKDLRWGFRVLKEAGFLATDKVTENVIWKAVEIVDRDMLKETIQGFDLDQLIVLWAIAFLEDAGITPMTGTVYHLYKIACDELEWTPRTMRHVMHYITPKLETQGLVTSKEKGLGRGRGKTLIFHIEEEPVKILNLVEKVLSEKFGRTLDHVTNPVFQEIRVRGIV